MPGREIQVTQVTAAQLQTLSTTSLVTLNLKSGESISPNGVLHFAGAFLVYNPGSTQFSPGTGTNLYVQYSSTYGGYIVSELLPAKGLIDQTTVTKAKLKSVSCILPPGATSLLLASSGALGASGTGTLSIEMHYDVSPN